MWIIENLGLIDYKEAHDYQEQLVRLKQEGEKNNFFLLLEHFPVFTRGKSARVDNLLDKSIAVYPAGRGGDMTFHEPGQLVGYVILDLKSQKLKIKDYVAKLENLIIDSLVPLGLNASKRPGIVGVWLENKKIASIGVAVKKGITMHGFALNVNNELEGFKKINPCGFQPSEISSLTKLTGKKINLNVIEKLIIEEFRRKF